MEEIKIGNKKVGGNNPVFVVAEIGLNHQGDVKIAKKLIDLAVGAGFDCVKFQKRNLDKIYKKNVLANPENQEHGNHYVLENLKKTELSEAEMKGLCIYSRNKGVEFLCTPWDEESLKFLSTLNLSAYKISSADMINFKLIHAASLLNKPLIISTGMSFVSEIERLVEFLGEIRAQYILLHCNSTYPAPYHDINLKFIPTLINKFNCNVGYSGHEQGIAVSLGAVSMGAKLIERHITLDGNLPGPVHRDSLEPDEFFELIKQIRIVEASLGEPIRYPSRGEYLNREALSKSIVATRNLKMGAVLTYADLGLRSPGQGTHPLKMDLFIGKKLIKRNVPKHDYLLDSDIDTFSGKLHAEISSPVSLNHKWGLVIRMNDIDSLIYSKPNFVEVHLTSSDVNRDATYHKQYPLDLVVHGPEYNYDLLLDLSSLDDNIRKRSIEFFNKTLAHARRFKHLFKNGNKPVKFIVHPGGMNMDQPLMVEKTKLYKNLADSLKKLDGGGFELLIENMPCHPWYFGGRWFHASFMDAGEIVKFSRKHKYGIAFDISHAGLFCNLYNKDLTQFTKTILPVTKYLHVSDAAGTNGEGLQIGDGTIDFKTILAHLVKTDLWFLPEIWQGHKYGGEGLLKALKKLKLIDANF